MCCMSVNIEAAFANACLLLSRGFSTPLDMKQEDAERCAALAEHAPEPLAEAASALADAWQAALTDREAVAVAYSKLFLGPFEVKAYPYASFYLEPEQQVMGSVTNYVATLYAEAGLRPGAGPREIPDHVALEWEFMYYLSNRLTATSDTAWSARRSQFFDDHVRQWMPAFADAVIGAEAHPFYTSLAHFMQRVVQSGLPVAEP